MRAGTYRHFKRYFAAPLPVAALWKPATGAAGAAGRAAGGGAARGGAEGCSNALAKAYNNLGVIYLTEGKYQEAMAAFQEAMKLSPRYYTKASENLRIAQQVFGALPHSPAALSIPLGESDAQAGR